MIDLPYPIDIPEFEKKSKVAIHIAILHLHTKIYK